MDKIYFVEIVNNISVECNSDWHQAIRYCFVTNDLATAKVTANEWKSNEIHVKITDNFFNVDPECIPDALEQLRLHCTEMNLEREEIKICKVPTRGEYIKLDNGNWQHCDVPKGEEDEYAQFTSYEMACKGAYIA